MHHPLRALILTTALGCAGPKDDGSTSSGTTPAGSTPGATTGSTTTGSTTTGSTTTGSTTTGSTTTGSTTTGSTSGGAPGGSTSGGATSGGTSPGTPGGNPGGPQWYLTCGDPVCSGYGGPWAGIPPCALGNVAAGDPCPIGWVGDTCDPVDPCNRLLECATSDPTMQPGGCPISLAAHKDGIRYVTPDERRELGRQVLDTRLATWRYRGELDDGREHVGFLIDDAPGSAAVRPDGGHVDLYGYTSLAVAAIQEQQRELEALRAEVEALKAACAAETPR